MGVSTRSKRSSEAANVEETKRRRGGSNRTAPLPTTVTVSPQKPSTVTQKQLLKANKYLLQPGNEKGGKYYVCNELQASKIELTLDLKNKESVLAHFPLVDGCGDLPFPIHILAYSNHLLQTFGKMIQFRVRDNMVMSTQILND